MFFKKNFHQQTSQSKRSDAGGVVQNIVKKLTKVHEIKTCILKNYEQITQVADYLKSKESVIVNLQYIDDSKFYRAIDFLTGVSYGIDGNIEKIGDKGTKIYIITPKSIELSSELRKTLTVSIDSFK